MRALTPQEAAFAVVYARTGNGAAAFRAAYKPDAASGVAAERGRRIRQREHVHRRIEELRAAGTRQALAGVLAVDESRAAVVASATSAPGALGGMPVPVRPYDLQELRDLATVGLAGTLPPPIRLAAVKRLLPMLEYEFSVLTVETSRAPAHWFAPHEKPEGEAAGQLESLPCTA